MQKSLIFILICLPTFAIANRDNAKNYYEHIHLAEEHLLNESFEKAYYSYQDAFEYLNPFATDLLNASCAMLYSEPDPQLLCQWNSAHFKQTGISIVDRLKQTDRRSGTNFMAQLTPDNWLDMEVCLEERELSLQKEFLEILMADSLFKMNWEYTDGSLIYKSVDAELQINNYGIYNVLPLNRFLNAKRFNQQEAGYWVMELIEKIMKANLNLNVSPILRGMKYKVQQGEIDNRYFSRLCDHMVSHSFEIKQELSLSESQFYFTHQISYDTLETYINFSPEILKEVDDFRNEIHLFDYASSINRIKYFKKTRLFFPYHQSIVWSGMSQKSMQKILRRVEEGELSLF